MMSLLDQLAAHYQRAAQTERIAMSRCAAGEPGCDAAFLAEQRGMTNVARAAYEAAAVDAGAADTTPAAHTSMGVDTSWWDADGYYHAN